VPPWSPPGYVHPLPGRGEIFYRHHAGGEPGAPTLLLLHGWTASADVQWYTAYERLAERYPFVAIDHRGHGRGIRSREGFRLEDCADDAMALVAQLGIERVVPVGYSMGGPISLLCWQRHRDHVAGMVLAATAMEWHSRRRDRMDWALLPLWETVLRSRLAAVGAARWTGWADKRQGVPHREWLLAELRRSDPRALKEAGQALATFDAQAFAGSVDVPTSVLITTRDRLVPPSKQRALAASMHAQVVELAADHGCTVTDGARFAECLRQAVDAIASSPEA
jgi:3-oxoadipate enol-lactonase